MLCIVYGFPIRVGWACGGGDPAAAGVASSYLAARYSARCFLALWIDESWMMLKEHLGFQPKGINALSFSSRKRQSSPE